MLVEVLVSGLDGSDDRKNKVEVEEKQFHCSRSGMILAIVLLGMSESRTGFVMEYIAHNHDENGY